MKRRKRLLDEIDTLKTKLLLEEWIRDSFERQLDVKDERIALLEDCVEGLHQLVTR